MPLTTVWQIEVLSPRGWVRMATLYRDKAVAQSWRKFCKAAWHAGRSRLVSKEVNAVEQGQ